MCHLNYVTWTVYPLLHCYRERISVFRAWFQQCVYLYNHVAMIVCVVLQAYAYITATTLLLYYELLMSTEYFKCQNIGRIERLLKRIAPKCAVHECATMECTPFTRKFNEYHAHTLTLCVSCCKICDYILHFAFA